MSVDFYVHPSASVSDGAVIGVRTKIWQNSQVRENTRIGENCIIGFGVYIDAGVTIGNNCKVQNGVSLYHGVTLEDGVFCGPNCVFTNDMRPRAINPDGTLQGGEDWVVSETLVRYGASIGANATIVCGTTIGQWAMIGAGAVVTRDVPDHALVYGNPAKIHAFMCRCGRKLETLQNGTDKTLYACHHCDITIEIPDVALVALE